MNRPMLVLSLAAAFGVAIPAEARQAQPSTVYISVVDSHGVPVPELRLTDLVVTEDSRLRQVVNVERATEPVTLALIVDEHQLWSGPLRASIKSLAGNAPRGWQIGLFSAERPEFQILDFTSDRNMLLHAIDVFAPFTTQHENGLVALESLFLDLASRFRRKNVARPVILAMGPQPYSSPVWDLVTKDILRSRVTMFAAVAHGVGRLIARGVEATGGRAELVLIETGLPRAVSRMVDDIVGQFALTYISPTPPRDGFRLRVRINRPDVDVRAPERVY